MANKTDEFKIRAERGMREKIAQYVKNTKDCYGGVKYEDRSDFIRCAINRLLREEERILELQQKNQRRAGLLSRHRSQQRVSIWTKNK